MDHEKKIDESWKANVEEDKQSPLGPDAAEDVTFSNYLTSLILQALIFLGEMPNPMDPGQTEANLPQAKMLIDTLILLREKTQGNLSKEEQDLINSGVYELQIKYVDKMKSGPGASSEIEA